MAYHTVCDSDLSCPRAHFPLKTTTKKSYEKPMLLISILLAQKANYQNTHDHQMGSIFYCISLNYCLSGKFQFVRSKPGHFHIWFSKADDFYRAEFIRFVVLKKGTEDVS